MKTAQLKVNVAGSAQKKQAWTGIVLFLVLAGLVALIVYEVRGPGVRKVEPQDDTPALQQIDKSIADLKKKIADKSPLQVAETLAGRPPAAPEQPPSVPDEPTAGQAASPDTNAGPAAGGAPSGRTAIFRESPSTQRPAREPSLELKGIFWSSSNPLALVNDAVVGLGEQIAGRKVVDIQADNVTFEDDRGSRRTVQLYKN